MGLEQLATELGRELGAEGRAEEGKGFKCRMPRKAMDRSMLEKRLGL